MPSDFDSRYEDTQLNIVLHTVTYLDPRFKDTFVAMEEEVKEHIFQKLVRPQYSQWKRSEQESSIGIK